MATSRDFPEMTMSQENEDAVRKAQIKAYVDWMNSQLKKKPGTRMVEDLKCDMQDGVALVDLVNVIADQSLDGTHPAPSNMSEMLANIQRVIDFMTDRRIKMHHTTAKDILDGNVKAIMRLILALAAHYKPNSVKQSSRGTPTKANSSMAGIAQSAAVALAEARRDVSFIGHRPQRPPSMNRLDRSEVSYTHHHQFTPSQCSQRESPHDGASSCGSPSMTSPRGVASLTAGSPRGVGPRKLEFAAMSKSRSQDFHSGAEAVCPYPVVDDDRGSVDLSLLGEEHSLMDSDISDTKDKLLQLQQLLLNGVAAQGDISECGAAAEASNNAEEIVILRSKLQQAEQHLRETREEMSKTRTECMELQGIKAGLQHRLSEQESSFLVLKAELLRAGFCQQSLENTKSELEQKLNGKDKIIMDIRRELSRRDQQLDKYHVDYHSQQHVRENATHNIKAQIIDLHDKIKKVGETEGNLSSRMISQDRKLLKLESKILQSPGAYDSQPLQTSLRSIQSHGSDDFQLVRESLRSLRSRFPGDDPQHQTIDALEQSISSLMERLNVTEQDSRWSDTSSIRRPNLDSTGDIRRSPITALPGLPLHRLDSSNINGHPATKVLYFTDRTVTPFMCTIPKRLGEIVLRDIKELLDRPGNYRYHFKAMDPEFGTVKEEITLDGDLVPGWEGKIVAWIEEDHG